VVAGLIALQVLLLGRGGVAHVVHLGGALVGYLMMKLYQTGYDLASPLYIFQRWWYRLRGAFQKRVSESKNNNMYSVSDVEVVKEDEQSDLDDILDKISNEGYDSLTRKE